MSVWRRKAIEAFPSLRRFLNDPDTTIYGLYFELLPMVRDAHKANDVETLERIYNFAEWCLRQREDHLGNAVCVAFYEHLFDDVRDWKAKIERLSPLAIQNCITLWKNRLSVDEFKRLQQLINPTSLSTMAAKQGKTR